MKNNLLDSWTTREIDHVQIDERVAIKWVGFSPDLEVETKVEQSKINQKIPSAFKNPN